MSTDPAHDEVEVGTALGLKFEGRIGDRVKLGVWDGNDGEAVRAGNRLRRGPRHQSHGHQQDDGLREPLHPHADRVGPAGRLLRRP